MKKQIYKTKHHIFRYSLTPNNVIFSLQWNSYKNGLCVLLNLSKLDVLCIVGFKESNVSNSIELMGSAYTICMETPLKRNDALEEAYHSKLPTYLNSNDCRVSMVPWIRNWKKWYFMGEIDEFHDAVEVKKTRRITVRVAKGVLAWIVCESLFQVLGTKRLKTVFSKRNA